MPSFPQHRNMKGQGKTAGGGAAQSLTLTSGDTGANDQTNNLPYISDLLGSLVKKRRID